MKESKDVDRAEERLDSLKNQGAVLQRLLLKEIEQCTQAVTAE